MKISFGYACITELSNLSCGRKSTKSYLERQTFSVAGARLVEKASQNIADLKKLLLQNKQNRISLYRLPEDFLPQVDLGYYDWTQFIPQLAEIGAIANKYNMTLSTHPSQFFLLATPREDVVEKTVFTFNLWADIFDAMQLKNTPMIVTHVGGLGSFNNHTHGCDVWISNFDKLSPSAKSYLVVENDQNSYSIEHCHYIYQQTNVPVVFDSEHFKFNPGSMTFQSALTLALTTWGNRTPKLHLSSQDDSKTRHAHSEYINVQDYIDLLPTLRKSKLDKVHIMLEVKQKDKALLKLREDLRELGYLKKKGVK